MLLSLTIVNFCMEIRPSDNFYNKVARIIYLVYMMLVKRLYGIEPYRYFMAIWLIQVVIK